MKISIVINVYIDVNEGFENPFDHPTSLERFETENTLQKTIKSINKLYVDTEDSLRIIIFAIATQKNTECDSEIKKRIQSCVADCPYEILIFRNSDIIEINKSFNSPFLSVNGYPEIRNLGFIIPIVLKDDVIIQIDDDEMMRPEYIIRMKEILVNNPEKCLFTAPYEKNDTVRIKTEDKLKSWKKFSSMAEDMENFYFRTNQMKETLFGFGGNMMIRNEFAKKVFYPLNVPRGEDFSMLLAARLVYENGNAYAGIRKNDEALKAYFAPYKELTIIHEPPHEAKADFLKYFENNMRRFIMEWGIFSKQKNLTVNKLSELSKYIKEMIGYDDIEEYVKNVLKELNEKFSSKQVESLSEHLLTDIKYYKSIDRFEEYKKLQRKYVDFIEDFSTDDWLKQLLNWK